jgi:hypothetical protein
MSTPSLQTVILRPTKCRICGHEFPGNSLSSATILGSNPAAKMQQISALISPLMKHLQKKHPEQLQWTQMQGGEWAGLLALNFIQCDEAEVQHMRDQTRWKINQMTRRVAITDERIEERLRLAYLTAMAKEADTPLEKIPPEMADDIMKTPAAMEIARTMREMRDVLEEKGRYDPPKVPVMNDQASAENPPNMTPAS